MFNYKFLWPPLKKLTLFLYSCSLTVIRDHRVSHSKMLFFRPPLEVAMNYFLNLAYVLMGPRFDFHSKL